MLQNLEENAILLLGRNSVDAKHWGKIEKIFSSKSFNWELFYQLCFAHGLWGFVFNNIKERFILPKDIYIKLSLLCQSAFKRNLLLFEEQKKILTLFNQEGLPVIPLKGIDFNTRVYGKIFELKTTTDIDFLVLQKDVHKAIDLLQRKLNYYTKASTRKIKQKSILFWNKDISFYKKKDHYDCAPSILELHWSLVFNLWLDHLALEIIWKEKILEKWENIPVLRMSPQNELLFLLVHGSKHRWECLRYVVDVHEFILKCSFNDKQWEEIVRKAFYFRWERFCFLGLSVAQKLYESPVPEEVLEKLGENWIKKEDIFSSTLPFPYIRHFSLFELFSSPKHKLLFSLKSLRFPSEDLVQKFPLPSFLSFLYIPLSAFFSSWAWLRRNFFSLFPYKLKLQLKSIEKHLSNSL
ncbi:nucleotidyltransferase domain-containing protein [Methylacidiphilum caldifontis]|uniref:Nucleotidyltransferase n=1 Tax=Methylacidiphilum caldifontis TaxID=2795386 RepID=A0A4Y8P8U1_9BACT|nr:nucleotidyltransferase family protein [Methylacidiphilum caldifontis]TFE66981.1 hypothetical protein A7Q10_01620 [Methylacidiphilum caldifontis]